MKVLKSISRSRLDEVAREILTTWAKNGSRAIVLLEGEMGAGKTELTKSIVNVLSGSEEAHSPSFAIHNEYAVDGTSIHHLDLFRLENEDDLESTGFWEIFGVTDALVLIEWASKLEDFGLASRLPQKWKRIQVKIRINDDSTRDFEIRE